MGWQDDPVAAPVPAQGPAPAVAAQGEARWQQDPIAPPPFPEIPPSGKQGGVARNMAAGANEAAAGILGSPVDAVAGLINRIASPFTGTAGNEFGPATKLSVPPSMADVPQPPEPRPLIENPIGGSESIKSLMGAVGADPRNVGTNNTPEAVARNVGGDVVGMVAPYLGARALLARGIGVPSPTGAPGSVGDALIRAAGGSAPPEAGVLRTGLGAAGNAAVGAGASLGGQGAEGLLPENSPYRPVGNMAGQVLGGGLMAGGMGLAKAGINTGVNQARETLAPMFQSTREGLVGRKLLENASNPEAFATALENPNPELVPGSQPTSYQLTGDQGIGQLERAQRTAIPEPFLERAGEQNAARVGQVQALAPENAQPTAVRDLLQQRLSQIDQEGDANVVRAQQNAQQAFDATGGRLNPDDYGAMMRDQMEAAKADTKQRESALWQAIDPEGKLTINGKPVAEAANQIISEVPKTAKPPEGEENAVFGFARMLGSASPFSDFTALRGRLLQAIRDERVNGQTPALRRMQQLRSAMDETISNAADNVAQEQQQAVARGALSPEQTLQANMARHGLSWYADRDAAAGAGTGGIAGTGTGRNAGAGSQALSRMAGAESPEGGQPGGASGGPGLQGQAPVANFDPEAADRYRAAADATRDRAQTFNNPQVGPLLAERGTDYRLADSQVPSRVFNSPESVQAFVAAGGRPDTLKSALVSDLRRSATNPDGSLNTARYQSWIRQRANALRFFPELQTQLGAAEGAQTAVDSAAATARQNTLDFQRGAARHFLNAEPMQAVQSAFASKNPVADFSELARTVAADPDAKAGLQRAVADYISRNFIGNTEVGTSGIAGLKSDALQTFLKRNGPALQQVFSPDQVASMDAVAADLQRSNRSIVGSKIPGQSNTAQDLLSQNKLSVLKKYLGQGVLTAGGGLAGYLMGGIHGAIEGAGGTAVVKGALDRLRAAGIESTNQLLTEALLHPDLARTLLMKASGANRPFIAQRLGSQLGTLLAVSGADQSTRH